MDYSKNKAKLLDQLYKATGINFDITDSSLSEDDTILKLKDMLAHFNVADSKNDFYKEYFTGQLSASDALVSLDRLHIPNQGLRILFYLESQHDYSNEAVSLLKSLLPNSADVVVEMDKRHLVVVAHIDSLAARGDNDQMASELLDMLETETYTSFKLAFDSPVDSFNDLASSYKNAVLSMRIGNVFFSSERIYSFADLGLGRLLYSVPEEESEAYLENHISFEQLSNLDEETLNTLNAFFDCDLSIAETARMLFVHRNTLIYRLDKFADLTGYDVRKFSDAITIKICLMLYQYLSNN